MRRSKLNATATTRGHATERRITLGDKPPNGMEWTGLDSNGWDGVDGVEWYGME